MKSYIKAARLRTLPLSISGIIMGSALAYYDAHFDFLTFVLAILVTISLQILSNLANDYGDGVKGTDNANRVGPERAIQSGAISPDEMFRAIRINVLITLVLVVFLILNAFEIQHFLYAFLFLVLGGISIYAAIKYTVGESAYGYRALGDLMVFLFFGLLSVIGTYVLYTKQLDYVVVLPACVIGLLSTGVLNLNNMRDIDNDKVSGKITVAVKLGLQGAKRYHFFLIGTAIVLSLLFGVLYYTSVYSFLFVIAYVPLFKHLYLVFNVKASKDLDPQLKVLALTTFFLTLLMSFGHIYSLV
ncbi:MAG: 1,4-dihydroxy-2-naphthoate octaprenyltransferase [Flavobacteriaceae bacterium]|nr:1,4-dihydroxy-2-naphthoate octaprenyltransferase [Flavobacteriaceae bacterium]